MAVSMIGQLLDGKYEVIKLIGEGGMGAVYEARDGDGRRCAVKVVHNEAVAVDSTLLARFEREVLAVKKVVSPHIVEILDAGRDLQTQHAYMVMELLEGENTQDLVKRLGPIKPTLAIRLGLQTCAGMMTAHDAGIVHRDIKPANLFLANLPDGGRVLKLLDFGVAKFRADQASAEENALTRTGSMLGSPIYMSPEQARGLKTIDHRADIWSLGIVMYQLLSGETPHPDVEGLGELILTICSEPPPLVNVRAPWVPAELAEVIAGALQLSTGERYQQASEFSDALRSCLDDGQAADAPLVASMVVAMSPTELQERATERPPGLAGQSAQGPAPAEDVRYDATVALEDFQPALNVPEEASRGPADDTAPTVALEDDERGEPRQRQATPSLDAAMLAAHRRAQKAAIDAARLQSPSKEGGGSSWPLLLIALVLSALGVGAYLYSGVFQ